MFVSVSMKRDISGSLTPVSTPVMEMCLHHNRRYCFPSDGAVNRFQLHTSPNGIRDLWRKRFISPTHVLYVATVSPALDWTGSRSSYAFHLRLSTGARSGALPASSVFVSKHLSKHPLKNVCLFSCILVCWAVNGGMVCVVVYLKSLHVPLSYSHVLMFCSSCSEMTMMILISICFF